MFTINLHLVKSDLIPTYSKLNLPLTSSIYLVFLPLEIQKRLEQTKVYHTFFTSRNTKKTRADQSKPHVFLLCLKRNDLQTFQSSSCEIPFFSVCVIHATSFDEYFLLCVITWGNYFSWKTNATLRFFKCHVAAFLEAGVLKEALILCINSAITILC